MGRHIRNHLKDTGPRSGSITIRATKHHCSSVSRFLSKKVFTGKT